MITLNKIYATDCEVCASLKDRDADLIKDREDYDFAEHDLETFGAQPSRLRDYVVNYHVDEEGMVELPVYAITENGRIQASTVAKDIEDVRALVTAWDQYKLQAAG